MKRNNFNIAEKIQLSPLFVQKTQEYQQCTAHSCSNSCQSIKTDHYYGALYEIDLEDFYAKPHGNNKWELLDWESQPDPDSSDGEPRCNCRERESYMERQTG